jgi:hypothetical protein
MTKHCDILDMLLIRSSYESISNRFIRLVKRTFTPHAGKKRKRELWDVAGGSKLSKERRMNNDRDPKSMVSASERR